MAAIRIRVINPDGGLTRDDLAFRERRLSKAAHPDTEISIVCPTKNDIPVDSMPDGAPDSGGILEMALAAERDAFDAVCLEVVPKSRTKVSSRSVKVKGGFVKTSYFPKVCLVRRPIASQ